ncbi:MAG: transposase [Vicinamibacterales bacterium]
MLLRTTLAAACDEIEMLATNMRAVERQLGALASEMADVTLLQTVPGVGVITATALVALIADIRRFPSGRHFASFLGLTPKEDSSGSRRRLGAISKRCVCAHAPDARRPLGRLARENGGAAHVAATVGRADRTATRAQCRRPGPVAAFGGALRAALTRAHAAAWAQLCQRRKVLRWQLNERILIATSSFLLDGGVQIPG